MESPKKFETAAIRTQVERTQFQEHAAPVYLTSSFMFEDAEEMRAAFADEIDRNIYSRFTNPNTSEFIQKLCVLEGAEAGMAMASGMSAVFSTFGALLKSGDRILSSRSIFGSTHTVFTKIFPKWDIQTDYVDVNAPDSWAEAVRPETKIIYLETPSNPGLDIIDLEWAGQFAKEHHLLLAVDNCFATPYLQQPIQYGADLVIHSATKYLDGQGRVLGGATVGRADLIKEILAFCRSTGPSLSPFNAWLLSKSLETLAVRMDRHADNAYKIAQFLETHPQAESVKYPGLPSHPKHDIVSKQMRNGGGMVVFQIKGGLEAGKQFLDRLTMCSLTANLGDTRTIVTHPASTTHAKLSEEERASAGISPGMIRISVGLENEADIIADIGQALG